MLTNRDRQYLRAVFKLKGSQKFVGPQELANAMSVTKVCAFQKMRRLEVLGLGEYAVRKGLKLNEEGVTLVEEEIRRHHVLERFLSRTLNMTSQEACDHSSHMGPFICEEVLRSISENLDQDIDCECGHCLHDCNGHRGAEDCHWLKRGI
jgi:DtxR family Mn-dependent transcriptional regulator